MSSSRKSKIKNIFSKISKFFLMFVVIFVSVIAVACGAASSSSSGFDALGNYRIQIDELTFYNVNPSGQYDEYTGSFILPMKYYYSKSYAAQTGIHAYDFDHSFDQDGNHALPLLDNNNQFVANGTSMAGLNYYYPDYTFWVDGFLYQIHVYVDYSKLVTSVEDQVNLNNSDGQIYYGNKNHIKVVDGADLSDVFDFSYRVGTSGKWLDANGFTSAIYLGISEVSGGLEPTTDASKSYDNVFYLSFHPSLHDGTNNRRIRVKATPKLLVPVATENGTVMADSKLREDTANQYAALDYDSQVRGDSLYSKTYYYNAYKMMFRSNIVAPTNEANTSERDTGDLGYDANKYFFYENNYSTSNSVSSEMLTSITGFFPEGRKVNVSRNFNQEAINGYENGRYYAFQSWTTNSASVNTLAIPFTMPKSNPFANKYDLFEDFDNGYHALFGATGTNKFAIKTYESEIKSEDVSTAYEVYTAGANDNGVGNLFVVSNEQFNNYIFYANYVKVDNFILAGSLFDADKILTKDDSHLSEVVYMVFSADNAVNPYITSQPLSDYTYFIKGLHYGDYVIFHKTEEVDNVELEYNFYGSDMSTHPVDDDRTALSNYLVNENYITAVIVTNTATNRNIYLTYARAKVYLT